MMLALCLLSKNHNAVSPCVAKLSCHHSEEEGEERSRMFSCAIHVNTHSVHRWSFGVMKDV
jgi:hypothetical protein